MLPNQAEAVRAAEPRIDAIVDSVSESMNGYDAKSINIYTSPERLRALRLGFVRINAVLAEAVAEGLMMELAVLKTSADRSDQRHDIAIVYSARPNDPACVDRLIVKGTKTSCSQWRRLVRSAVRRARTGDVPRDLLARYHGYEI